MKLPFKINDPVWAVVGDSDDGYSASAAKIIGKHPSGPSSWVVEHVANSFRDYFAERELFHSEADAWREIVQRNQAAFRIAKANLEGSLENVARLEGKA